MTTGAPPSKAAPAAPDLADLDRRIVTSSGWVALSYGGRSLLGMGSTLVLAHLLEPRAFGVFALATVVLAVLDTVQHGGVGAAIIYRRSDDTDAADATAFAFTAVAGAALAGVALLLAPLLAAVLHAGGATGVFRALAPLVFLRGLAVVPGAILERRLDFRSRAKAELSAGVGQIGVAIGLAAAGAGVWSLVAGQLAAGAVQTTALWTLVRWRPPLRRVRRDVLRELVGYGRFVSLGNLLALVNGALDTAIVGRIVGAQGLAFYSLGYKLADMPTNVIGYVVGRVMFPAYARMRTERSAFRRAFVQNLERVALLVLPVSVLLVVAAEPLVDTLLGERWHAVATPLRILAVFGAVRGFASPCGAVFQAAGRPALVPLWSLPHALLVVPLLIVLSAQWGVTGAAAAVTIAFSASAVPAFVTAVRLLELDLGTLRGALAPPLRASASLAAALFLLRLWADSLATGVELALLLAVGAVVYTAAARVFARETVLVLADAVRTRPSLRTRRSCA